MHQVLLDKVVALCRRNVTEPTGESHEVGVLERAVVQLQDELDRLAAVETENTGLRAVIKMQRQLLSKCESFIVRNTAARNGAITESQKLLAELRSTGGQNG